MELSVVAWSALLLFKMAVAADQINNKSTKRVDLEFDYDATKELYLSEVEKIKGFNHWYTEQRIRNIIKKVKNNTCPDRILQRYAYSESEINGECTLFLANGMKQVSRYKKNSVVLHIIFF